MTPEQRRARAYAAQALMNDPTLQQGWAEIENDTRQAMEATAVGIFGRRRREALHAELKHLKALRQKLAAYAGQAPRD